MARKVFRSRKQDSAYVYAILESYEGVVSYSTLDGQPTDLHRDLEITYSPETEKDVLLLLQSLSEVLYELPSTS